MCSDGPGGASVVPGGVSGGPGGGSAAVREAYNWANYKWAIMTRFRAILTLIRTTLR